MRFVHISPRVARLAVIRDPRSTGITRTLFGGAVLMLAGISCGQKAIVEPPEQGRPVVVAAASSGSIEAVIEAIGEARPVRDAELAAEALGKVIWIADEGARLDKGAIVAKLAADRASSQAISAEARAASSAAEAEQKSRDVDRLRRLHNEGAVSRREIEQAESAAEAAAAKAQADLAEAREAADWLAEKIVRAPFAGVILEKRAESGEVLSPGAAVARLGDISSLEVTSWVGEADALHIRSGAPARIVFDAIPGETTVGAVKRVGQALSTGARTAEVVVEIDNSDHRLPSGLMARVKLSAERRETALRIPIAALRTGPDGTAVWIVDSSSRIRRRSVLTGLRNSELIEILDGLAEGDSVVIRGGESVGEGDLVEAGAANF